MSDFAIVGDSVALSIKQKVSPFAAANPSLLDNLDTIRSETGIVFATLGYDTQDIIDADYIGDAITDGAPIIYFFSIVDYQTETLAEATTNLGEMNAQILTAGSRTFIISEYMPFYELNSGDPPDKLNQENNKKWAAGYREFCRVNEIWFAPLYDEMCDPSTSNEDSINPAYFDNALDPDGIHPDEPGYSRIAQLWQYAGIPSRYYIWGFKPYIANSPNDESWKRFIFSGSGEILGNSDNGNMSLANAETAVSSVKCLPAGPKPLTIGVEVQSGACTIEYRSSLYNYGRIDANDRNDDVVTYTSYTTPLTGLTDEFFQVKVTAIGATIIRNIFMSWGDLPPLVLSSGGRTISINTKVN